VVVFVLPLFTWISWFARSLMHGIDRTNSSLPLIPLHLDTQWTIEHRTESLWNDFRPRGTASTHTVTEVLNRIVTPANPAQRRRCGSGSSQVVPAKCMRQTPDTDPAPPTPPFPLLIRSHPPTNIHPEPPPLALNLLLAPHAHAFVLPPPVGSESRAESRRVGLIRVSERFDSVKERRQKTV
jgi:hypothetical protein